MKKRSDELLEKIGYRKSEDNSLNKSRSDELLDRIGYTRPASREPAATLATPAKKAEGPTILPGSALDEMIKERDAFETEKGYSKYRYASDFKKNSAVTGSKGDKKFYLFDPSTWKKKGDDLYDFINDIDGYREHFAATQGGPAQSYNDYEDYAMMNSDEIDMYNYLYNKQGQDKANQYLSDIRSMLGERKYEAREKELNRMAEEKPVRMSLLSVPTAMVGGVVSAVDLAAQNLERLTKGEPVSYYSSGQRAGAAAQILRDAVGKEIEDNTDFTIAGRNVGRFVYDTAMSGADSLAAGALGKGLGGSLLGINAATSTARDIAARGGNDRQALIGGIAAGVFEGLFERLSIGNFEKLKEVPVATLKDFGMNLAKAMSVNASEEAATEAANLVADRINMGDLSTWNTVMEDFEAQGMDRNEARRQTIKVIAGQIAEAAASGALMSVGFSGLSSASSALSSRSIGSQIQDVDPLRQAAMEMQDSDSQRLAQKIGEEPSRMQKGNLLRTLAEDTAARYMEQGMAEGEARQKAADDVFALLEPKKTEVAPQVQQTEGADVKPTEAPARVADVKTDINTSPAPVMQDRGVATMQKAVYNDSGAEVEIEGISSVENGQVYVQLSDGGTADVDDISFDDPEIDQLYAQAADFDTDTAKAFIAGYEGGSVSNYLKGFKSMQGSAKAGLTYEQASESVYTQEYLTENGRQYAYAAGQRAAAPQQTGSGVVRKFSGTLSTSQSQALKGIDAVAKAINRKVNIVDTIPVTDAKGSIVKGAVNAYFDSSTNEYYIALDGVGEAYSFFALHESIHDIAANNELGYASLEEIVFDVLKEQGADIDALMEVQKNLYPNESEAYWREEIVANTVPAILTDKATADMFIERIIGADADTRTVFERILDSILDFLQKAYDVLKGEKSWQQMELVKQNQDAIERIRDAYFAALEDLQGAEAEQGEGVRLSAKDNESIAIKKQIVQYQDELNNMDSVANLDSEPRPRRNGKADRALMRQALQKSYGSLNFGVDRKGFGVVQFDANAIHQLVEYIKTDAEFAAAKTAPAIVKRGIEINHHIEHKGRKDIESYTFAAPVILNGKIGNAAVVVQFTNRNKPHSVRILMPDGSGFNLDAIEKSSQTVSAATENGSRQQRIGSASINSIADREAENKRKFSMRDVVEETDSLIALHNLTGEKLAGVLDLGGFPMPSIAVTRYDIPHENFGDISIVFDKSTIDPKADRRNTVYSADAWTPTFPRVEYETDPSVEKRIKNRLRIGSSNLDDYFKGELNRITYGFNDLLDRYGGEDKLIQHVKDNYGLKAVHIQETGGNVDVVTKQVENDRGYNAAAADMYKAIREVFDGISIDDIVHMPFREILDKYGEQLEEIRPGITKTTFRLGGVLSGMQNYYENRDAAPTYRTEMDLTATKAAIDERIDEAAYDRWVNELFSGIEGDSGIYNGKDRFTPSGNLRSFKQTHLPVTLENIAKAMAAQNKGNTKNVAGFNGVKTLRAGTAVRFKSIKDMHKLEGRLQNLTEAEQEKLHNALSDRMYALMDKVDESATSHWETNAFIRLDAIGNILMEIADSGKYSVNNILKTFRQYGYDIDNDLANEAMELLFDIQQMPVNLFEAKPERAVGLDEIQLVVMPMDEYEDIKERLQDLNIPVEEYDPDVEGDRLRVLNSEPARQYRFSLNDTASVSTATLESELAKKDKVIADLKAQFKLTEGHRVSDKAINKLAGKILKEYSSSYDRETLVENLRTMFDYIANTEQPVWDEVFKQGMGMAKKIVRDSAELDTELYRYYAKARDYLRTTRIKMTSVQRDEAAYLMGSYRNYRQALFGSVNLMNSGIYLDSAWGEIGQIYPELFKSDTNEGDMVDELLAIVSIIKPVYRNPYGYDMDGVAYDLFLRIYDEYFDMPEVKTFADKKAAELAKVKARYSNRIAQIRQESKARYEEKLKKLRAENVAKRQELSRKYKEALAKQHKADIQRYREQYKMLSDRKNEQLMNQKAAFQAWKEKDRMRSDVRKYQQRIEKKAKDLSAWLLRPTDKKHVPESLRNEVSKFLETLEFTGSAKAAEWRYRMEKLAAFMEKLDNAEGETIYLDLEDSFAEAVRNIAKTGGNLATMDVEQLKELDTVLGQLKKAVQEVNTILVNGRRQELSDYGDEVIAKADAKGPKYGGNNAVAKLLSSGNIKPVYFFKNLGGPMQKLFNEIREAQNKVAFGAQAAKEFYEKAAAKHNLSGWKDDTLKMRTERGNTIELTRQQAMSLYAIYKRELANKDATGAAHLSKGGFVYADEQTKERTGKLGIKTKTTFKDAKPKPLSPADMAKISGWLTTEQKAFADELVEYMSTTMAGIGNTTSMKISGYKKFAEGYYFPYKSSRAFLNTQAGTAGQDNNNRWKNWGSAKATQAGANNPIVLQDFTEVWADHVNEMLMYAHMSIPQENLLKVFNYRTRVTDEETSQSVKAAIQNAYGEAAMKYIDTLLADLGGNVLADPRDNFGSKLTSRFKKGAVLASLSVAIQQPSAIVRAMALVDPKYFVTTAKKGSYDEAMKYAGTAVIKRIGGFDTGTGHGMADWITELDPEKKVKAFFDRKDSTFRDKVLGWGPGKMDEITWGHLWEAVKNEVAAEKHLKPGTAEHLEAAGKRFNDVVEYTQVYDSTISRSELMRSKSAAAQMATAFMAEPVTAYNMLYDAFVNKTGVSKQRALSAFIGTTVFNALLKSIVYALRDDGDQAYREKYVEAVTDSLLGGKAEKISWLYGLGSDLNPINLIPYARDIASIMQGYDVERADMALIGDFVGSLEIVSNDNKTIGEKIRSIAEAISAFFGIPLKNVLRDTEAIYDSAKQYVFGDSNFEVTERGIQKAIRSGLGSKDTVTAHVENLYSAYEKGDTKRLQRSINEISGQYTDKVDALMRSGKTRQEAEKSARSSMLQICTPVLKAHYLSAPTIAEKMEIRSLALRIKIGNRQLYAGYDFDQHWK